MIRVFIGTDRSQLLATRVLTCSLKATTSCDIMVQPLDKLKLPEPKDVRQSQRTGFSFARWAIPELCEYKGQGIYLDADMLVFSDIAQLWNHPMGDATIAIVDGTNGQYCSSGIKLNKNETSVMVVNCERAKWTLETLVHGLDGEYTYPQMMSDLCFLKESSIVRTIPRSWNSMDYWDKTTNLIHFTNVPTQPWVSLDNSFGYIWIDYLKEMVAKNEISFREIEKEISLGYIRPSLLRELHGKTASPSDLSYINDLKDIDTKAGYVPHREVMEWNKRRSQAIKRYERKEAREKGLMAYGLFELKNMVRHMRDIMRIQ